MIPIKTADEVTRMREACRIAAIILNKQASKVGPGANTYDLDQYARELMEEYGAVSACYNYRMGSRSFPAYTCISVNEEIVHGIGSMRTVLQPGDIVSLDVSIIYQGFIGDNAKTVAIRPVEEKVDFLLRSTESALHVGIDQARSGNRVGDISNSIQVYIESRNLSIVRDFVGHGVGRTMHEEPQIPNYGPAGKGSRLKPGMTLAIEPMVNLGNPEIEIKSDGWTAMTQDRSPSAHFEHTVLITNNGPEILTRIEN